MKSLERARRELIIARESLTSLQRASNLTAWEVEWSRVLQHIERCWNKTKGAMKERPKWQGWTGRGRIEKLRDSDPLLAYLCNARGADEHSVAEITDKVPGGIGVGPPRGSSSVHIKTMRINGPNIHIESDQPLTFSVIRPRLALKTIVNRGREYPVPTTHLGMPLGGVDLVTVANAGINFYEDALRSIEQEFG